MSPDWRAATSLANPASPKLAGEHGSIKHDILAEIQKNSC
jgi:hypothetical protein